MSDSSQQPDWPALQDENFGFELPPLADDGVVVADVPFPEDGNTRPEDEDEPFGFSTAPLPADVAAPDQPPAPVLADLPEVDHEDFGFYDFQAPDQSEFEDQIFYVDGGQPDPTDDPEDYGFVDSPFEVAAATDPQPVECSDDQLEDVDESFGFDLAPLPDDNDVAVSTTDENSESQGPWPEDDEDYSFEFDGVGPDFTTDQGGQDDAADQLEDSHEDFGFSAGPLSDDAVIPDPTPQGEDDASQLEDVDEDFGFADAPLCEDSPQLSLVDDATNQPTDPENEPFGFDAGPLPDDVQEPLPFCECSDGQPEDVIEEPQGFVNEPIQADQVFEEPLPFCDFPAQAEEPQDEDFGFSVYIGFDEIGIPVVIPPDVTGGWPTYYGRIRKTKQVNADVPRETIEDVQVSIDQARTRLEQRKAQRRLEKRSQYLTEQIRSALNERDQLKLSIEALRLQLEVAGMEEDEILLILALAS
tara:strand:+ start:653 stop:2068 length:1416 start_codon:yes stop_codon:yes gene_type:complete